MNLTKLGCLVSAFRLANNNASIFSKALTHRTPAALLRYKSDNGTPKKVDDDDDLNKPIKFLGSEAETWNAVHSRTGGNEDRWPWYQPYVVMASVATFLIYFCIYREENDIDEMLSMDLSEHFQGEAKKNILLSQRIPYGYQQKMKKE